MIIGRKEEISRLVQARESEYSEFVAVYGRRRIGKTFLIRNVFENQFTFQYSGIFGVTNKEQIHEFYTALINQGLSHDESEPASWFEAFHLLEKLIDGSDRKRKIVFIDELPWMDARNSGFIPAFEHFWNGWASGRRDVLLIICGSATSWIINKIFRSKGGLYNRVTCKIALKQFSLAECEEMARHKGLSFNRNMILECYMAIGGVPYYWSKLVPGKSALQNINDLFLRDDGELRNEFTYIYNSMFSSPEKYLKVIKALAGKKSGLTRDEIISKAGIDSSGRLSGIIEDLAECGFIRKYCHPDKKLKDALYQLVDCYSLFYYHFVAKTSGIDENYLSKIAMTPAYATWCGLAFERVCLLHSRQIKAALGISGILANLFSWHIKKTADHPGVQIDLIIDRSDGIVNVCEMKFAPEGYRLTSAEKQRIFNRVGVLKLYLPRSKVAQPVLITSHAVIRNSNSDEIPLQVTADRLFMP